MADMPKSTLAESIFRKHILLQRQKSMQELSKQASRDSAVILLKTFHVIIITPNLQRERESQVSVHCKLWRLVITST